MHKNIKTTKNIRRTFHNALNVKCNLRLNLISNRKHIFNISIK